LELFQCFVSHVRASETKHCFAFVLHCFVSVVTAALHVWWLPGDQDDHHENDNHKNRILQTNSIALKMRVYALLSTGAGEHEIRRYGMSILNLVHY